MGRQKRRGQEEIYEGKKYFSEEDLLDICKNFKGLYIPLKKIPYHLFTDKNIIKKLLKRDIYTPDLIKILPDSFKSKNKELMKNIILGDHGYQGFRELPVKLRKDKRFVLDILEGYIKKNESSSWIYGDTNKTLRNDKDVALVAMRSGGYPRDLPKKFKENKSMVLAYLEHANSQKHLPHYCFPHHSFEDFNFKKIKFTKNFANSLIQADPLNYVHLDTKHKNKKEWAMSCVKKDVTKYNFLPKRLKLNTEIMEYVFSMNPYLSSYLRANEILKIDFSKLNLGKKEREIIYSHCEGELINEGGIFELAQAKKVVFNPFPVSLKANSSDSFLSNKNKVLKKIDKLLKEKNHNKKIYALELYNSILYELKIDIDILLKLAGCGLSLQDIGEFKVEKNTELKVNAQLFIKRKYNSLQLPKKNKKLREYMISKICANRLDDSKKCGFWALPLETYHPESVQLSNKERKKLIEDSFYYINFLKIENKLKLVKHLSRDQLAKLIISGGGILRHLEFHDYAFKMFGNAFKKDVELAKRIFMNWPKKSLLKVLDLDYLLKNTSFKSFLKNVNKISIHEDDFLRLPGSLKRNKVFIQKVLAYNFELYEHLSSALKTDKEITDWIFTIAPRQAKSLALNDFEKIDTSDLHPSSRKIIYRQYLRKSSDDIFEKALMKRKLLHIKDFKKAS